MLAESISKETISQGIDLISQGTDPTGQGSDPNGQGSSLGSGGIVGIVIALLIIIALLVVVFIIAMIWRIKHKSLPRRGYYNPSYEGKCMSIIIMLTLSCSLVHVEYHTII